MTKTRPAARVGNVLAVACTNWQSARSLADGLRSRGYIDRETPHFVVCQRASSNPTIILIHTYSGATIDEDVSSVLADELGRLGTGTVHSMQEYGDALFAIVASTSPPSLRCTNCGRLHLDNPAIWRQFSMNTLARLRSRLTEQPATVSSSGSHIGQFAAVYRRIMENRVGNRLLDVGSNLGVLPMLLAEHLPGITVVGCDSRHDAISAANDLSMATGNSHVKFVLRDVLAADFAQLGQFDTVTAVHLLEHLTESELPAALSNLLHATGRRLILAVPYEEPMHGLYGHQQVFTATKLRFWGNWCIETLGGGDFWCEEVEGGLLIVDPPRSAELATSPQSPSRAGSRRGKHPVRSPKS